MSDAQVQNFLLENDGRKTCGRFRSEQLKNDGDYLHKLLSTHIPLWKKFLAALFILFGGLLTGCNEPLKGKIVPTDQLETKGTMSIEELADSITHPPPIETRTFCPSVIVGDLEVEMIQPSRDTLIINESLPVKELLIMDLAPEDIPLMDTTRALPVKFDSAKISVKRDCEVSWKDSLTWHYLK